MKIRYTFEVGALWYGRVRKLLNTVKKDFPDFDHIVNAENLDYIDYHYPEVSRPLQRLNDGYEKS